VGILAASLPALRPLFKRMLETTREMRSKTRGTGAAYGEGYASNGGLGGTRHKYYPQEDIMGLSTLTRGGNKEGGGDENRKYDVRIMGKKSGMESSTNGMKSKASVVSGSSDDELPLQGGGITKTVDVSVV